MDEICHFPGIEHRSLSYAIKQLISHEIDLEKMRKETPVEEKKPVIKTPKDQQQPKPESQQRHLQKLQAKEVKAVERNPVDFFGRKIDPELLKKKAKEEEEKDQNKKIVTSDIWFRFKEGYNNAVRRNVRINEML